MTIPDLRRPNPAQRLLLTAALAPSDGEALAAWEQYSRQLKLDQIDWVSQRLIPLLHTQLNRMGVSHGESERFRGVHRYWWMRNIACQQHIAKLIESLHDAGVRNIMALGGLALIEDSYASLALRPIDPAELMISADDAIVSIETLRQAGFVPDSRPVEMIAPPWLLSLAKRKTGIRLAHEEYGRIQLWWSSTSSREKSIAWERCSQSELLDQPLALPCPEYSLLRACSEIAAGHQLLSLWAFADAVCLCYTHTIDWEYFEQLVQRHADPVLLAQTLVYLAKHFTIQVPEAVLHPQAANGTTVRATVDAALPAMSKPLLGRAMGLLGQFRMHRSISAQGNLMQFVRMSGSGRGVLCLGDDQP